MTQLSIPLAQSPSANPPLPSNPDPLTRPCPNYELKTHSPTTTTQHLSIIATPRPFAIPPSHTPLLVTRSHHQASFLILSSRKGVCHQGYWTTNTIKPAVVGKFRGGFGLKRKTRNCRRICQLFWRLSPLSFPLKYVLQLSGLFSLNYPPLAQTSTTLPLQIHLAFRIADFQGAE